MEESGNGPMTYSWTDVEVQEVGKEVREPSDKRALLDA